MLYVVGDDFSRVVAVGFVSVSISIGASLLVLSAGDVFVSVRECVLLDGR